MAPMAAFLVLIKTRESGQAAFDGYCSDVAVIEPYRDCRRPIGLSYAAMAGSSSIA